VIGAHTRGRYRERLADGEVQHRFDSSRRPVIQS
jgi:hypothetical protein